MRSEIMTSIVNDFVQATAVWYDELFPIAKGLFWTLAAIEITWSAMWWMLEREDPMSMIAAFLRKIVTLMFFYTLLLYFRDWSYLVLESFAEAGRRASGLAKLDPSTVLDQGIALGNILLRELFDAGLLGLGAAIIVAIAGFIVFLAFVVIAIQMMLTLVEAYFVLGAGVFLMGFAGSRFTAPFASRFLSFAVGIGVKLFVIHLVVGVGTFMVTRWTPLLEQSGRDLASLLQIVGGALVYAFLAWSIPNLAGSAMNGAVSLTLTDAAFAGRAASGLSGSAARGGAAVAAPVLNVLARVRNAVAPTTRPSASSTRPAWTASSARARPAGDRGATRRANDSAEDRRGEGAESSNPRRKETSK
jgi:type IV secretion system protein TrbL